jgi:hypothetical protein
METLATGRGRKERKNKCNHKKCNLNSIFHEGKGHFATRERALFVSSENLGALAPLVPTPPEYCLSSEVNENIKLFTCKFTLCLVLNPNESGIPRRGGVLRNLKETTMNQETTS